MRQVVINREHYKKRSYLISGKVKMKITLQSHARIQDKQMQVESA